jgi:excisionase family DNA binding protein
VTPTAETRSSSSDQSRPLAMRTSGPRLLSARETAAYLAIGYDTVLLLVKSGTLRPVRLPLGENELRKLLFDRVDLDRLVEASKA